MIQNDALRKMLLQVDSPIADSSDIVSQSLSLPKILSATSTLNSIGIIGAGAVQTSKRVYKVVIGL